MLPTTTGTNGATTGAADNAANTPKPKATAKPKRKRAPAKPKPATAEPTVAEYKAIARLLGFDAALKAGHSHRHTMAVTVAHGAPHTAKSAVDAAEKIVRAFNPTVSFSRSARIHPIADGSDKTAGKFRPGESYHPAAFGKRSKLGGDYTFGCATHKGKGRTDRCKGTCRWQIAYKGKALIDLVRAGAKAKAQAKPKATTS